jgi:hypothetical protein
MIRKYKILTVVLVLIIAAGAAYYIYGEFKNSQAQGYLKTSKDHQNMANTYFSQAVDYESKNDYTNAISLLQKSSDEVSQAQAADNDAQPYAVGVYRDYLDNDVLLLQAYAKLIEYKIYANRYKNNELNVGQEKVDPTVLAPYIANLTSQLNNYRDIENQIVAAHPEQFKFLS